MADAIWTFSPTLGDERLDRLLSPGSYSDIVAGLLADFRVLCCHIEPCGDADGFKRVVFCAAVSRPNFDLFFNSQEGYRGAFFRSPYEGIEANDFLFNAVGDTLLNSSLAKPEADDQFLSESLASPSRKVWLAEPERGFCKRCSGEWRDPTDGTADLMNGRWEHGVAMNNWRGRNAPYFTKLRFFGAFLDTSHGEFVAARKRFRPQDLYFRGWA